MIEYRNVNYVLTLKLKLVDDGGYDCDGPRGVLYFLSGSQYIQACSYNGVDVMKAQILPTCLSTVINRKWSTKPQPSGKG